MKTITLKELHQHTGKLARQASQEPLMITDRGHPIAVLGPPVLGSVQRALPRPFTFAATVEPEKETESSESVSRIRDEQ